MPETRNGQVAAMFQGGMTYQEIGDHFGISRERVRQILSRQGVKKEEGGHAIRAGVRLERAIEIYQSGKTIRDAARAAGADAKRLATEIDRRNMRRKREDRKHGTVASYQHGGCRCEKCRKANADYQRKRRLDRRGRAVLDSGARPATKGAA